jgi:hypothetical protein
MSGRISASQIELFGRCERRWAFSYRAGLKEPFAQAAEAGSQTHKIIELDGPYDAEWEGYAVGQMAALLKAQAPELGAKEQRFEVEIDGIPFVGVVDGQSADGKTIIDFKTTSRIKNAKSIAKLTDDPQRLMYTQFVPTADRTLWLYGTWNDMSVTKREVVIDRPTDKERFRLRVLQPAERMLAVPADVDPLSMKPNVNDCALFPKAGCPHKAKCFPPGKLSPIVTNSKESQIQMSSLLERLKAKNAAAGETAPEPVKLPEPPAAVKLPELTAVSVMPVPEPSRPVVVAPIAPVAQSVQQPDFEPQRIAVAPTLIETLFIDCIPLGEAYELASKYINAAAETAANDLQVPHYGLVDFGKGAPAVAAQLRSDLSGRRIKTLYLESRSPEGKACLNVLVSVSERVIKGVF